MDDFRLDPRQKLLGLTLKKPNQGLAGIARFKVGVYPACSRHGAMNRVSRQQMWRCLECNIGVEYDDDDIAWGRSRD